jgi:hypothetical protein
MPSYIRYEAPDGGTVLIEVADAEMTPSSDGVVKVGLKDWTREAVADAQTSIGEALQRAVRFNAQAIIDAVGGLPNPPDEVEITFGLKATGEAGNFAVCKAGGEANYAVKLAWKQGVG